MAIERILGTDTGKQAFEKTNRNFLTIDSEKLPATHNTDATSHNDIREQINDLVPKADIIQTTEVNDSTKVPSSVVTYGLKQNINTINSKFTSENLNLASSKVSTIILGNYMSYILYVQREIAGGKPGLYLLSTYYAVEEVVISTVLAATDITGISVDANKHIVILTEATGGVVRLKLIRL